MRKGFFHDDDDDDDDDDDNDDNDDDDSKTYIGCPLFPSSLFPSFALFYLCYCGFLFLFLFLLP